MASSSSLFSTPSTAHHSYSHCYSISRSFLGAPSPSRSKLFLRRRNASASRFTSGRDFLVRSLFTETNHKLKDDDSITPHGTGSSPSPIWCFSSSCFSFYLIMIGALYMYIFFASNACIYLLLRFSLSGNNLWSNLSFLNPTSLPCITIMNPNRCALFRAQLFEN